MTADYELYAALQADVLAEAEAAAASAEAESERLRQLVHDVVMEAGGYTWDPVAGQWAQDMWMFGRLSPQRAVELLHEAGFTQYFATTRRTRTRRLLLSG